MAIVDGDNGDNVLDGTNSADVINGFGGDDILNGLGGSDVLDGGTGNDSLFGGSGTNTLTGGTGADSFIVDAFASFNSAVDTITDFQIGTDLVDVSAWGVSSFDQLQRFFSQTGVMSRNTFGFQPICSVWCGSNRYNCGAPRTFSPGLCPQACAIMRQVRANSVVFMWSVL